MIIADLMGNLGNQLFIYAMSRALQEQYGEKIVFDLSGLKRWYYSADNKLEHFNIPMNEISFDCSEVDSKEYKKYRRCLKLYQVQQKYYRKTREDLLVPDSVTNYWFRKGYYFNTNRKYFEYPICDKKNKFLFGYFQAIDYFKNIEQTIKEELTVKDTYTEYDSLMSDEINNCNSVAVSIRAINEHGVSFVDYDYYYSAMKKISEIVDNPVFYVFSDSLENVKRDMKFPYPVNYVTPEDSVRGLRLLYSCKHFIITNSTFSWWGAYLAKNPNKVVIMPTPWDKDGRYRKEAYFDNCIKIDCKFVDYKVDLKQYIKKDFAK